MTFVQNLPVTKLAVVGMEAVWAGCDNLDAYEQVIYRGEALSNPQANAGGEPLTFWPARAALAALAALLDAGVSPGVSPLRVAALVAGASSDGMAASPDWRWAARVIDLSETQNPAAEALQHAQHLLAGNEADLVVFAAGAGLTSSRSETPLAEQPGFGFDRAIHAWNMGAGAGAVVFTRQDTAQAHGMRVYASVLAGAFAPGRPEVSDVLPVAPALDEARACCAQALEQAGADSQAIGYVEAFASGQDALDAIEIAALAQAYRRPAQEATTALGSAQSATGYLGAAAGLASLIRAALCLYRRMIPGAPGWSAPKLPALWRGAPFYVAAESRAWFARSGNRRLAAANLVGRGGSFAHVILAEPQTDQANDKRRSSPSHSLARGEVYLIPLAGDQLDDLLHALRELRRECSSAGDPAVLAAAYFAQMQERHAGARYGLSIVGRDLAEISREAELALKALPQAFEKSAEWQTPLGSCFTPEPAGRLGSTALVYPGAFNSYPGVGKDLFFLFPELYERMERITADIGAVIRERLLYPRSLTVLTKEEMDAREAALLADPVAMLNSGTALSILYTHILCERFHLQPAAAFGYSLGETSMLYAAGLWTQGDQAARRLAESGTFQQRLAGPQNAIRAYWGLPEAAAVSGEQPALWANFLVMAAPERVMPVLQNEPRVYLTHINTPRQVVIGGDPEACRRVIDALRCSALKAPFDYALHCAPMRSEFDALASLHDWPVEQASGLKMYTAADYGLIPTPYDHGVISQKIAHMLTSPLDFPRLIRQVYADGARVFVEAGAGSNCARWIDETLKGQPHLSISLNRRGTDDHSNLIRTLARLHAHRVPVDLSAVYRPALEKVKA